MEAGRRPGVGHPAARTLRLTGLEMKDPFRTLGVRKGSFTTSGGWAQEPQLDVGRFDRLGGVTPS